MGSPLAKLAPAVLVLALVAAGCSSGEKQFSGADASQLSGELSKPPASTSSLQSDPPPGNIIGKDKGPGDAPVQPPGKH